MDIMVQIIHTRVEIYGRVQGVGFRYSAVHRAHALNLKGYVRNLPNGRVLLEIEGMPDAVEAMIRWCRQGPPMARVDAIQRSDGTVQGYSEFTVR